MLRYGRIAYVNVAPIETAFDAGMVTRDVAVVTDVPARLNAQLLAGDLDVSAVSAAFYLTHRDELSLLGDLCIAATGPVRSVLLVSPVPPALLSGVPIAVTSQSASGRLLLEVLLEQLQGVHPTYEVVDDAPAAMRAGRPTLLIGDDALAARADAAPARTYDLGEAWTTWTSLPFVYAVWAVRNDTLADHPEEVTALQHALEESRTWANMHRHAVIDAAVAQLPFHRALYIDYFSRLTYKLTPDARRGLDRFAELTAEITHVAR